MSEVLFLVVTAQLVVTACAACSLLGYKHSNTVSAAPGLERDGQPKECVLRHEQHLHTQPRSLAAALSAAAKEA